MTTAEVAAQEDKQSSCQSARGADSAGLCCAGMGLANDSDAQRCNLLVHQTKRMCSPALMVVNHDATQMPILRKGGPKVTAPLHLAVTAHLPSPDLNCPLLSSLLVRA